jgi:hypothetical protein
VGALDKEGTDYNLWVRWTRKGQMMTTKTNDDDSLRSLSSSFFLFSQKDGFAAKSGFFSGQNHEFIPTKP